ncbi:hypothetical protein ACFL54_02565 [Planctomycetota bacterium]
MIKITRLVLTALIVSMAVGGCYRPFFFKKKEKRVHPEILRSPYFSKTVHLDTNNDGFIDQKQYYHAGVIVMVEFDIDHDGITDEVRHYDGQRLARVNNLPDNWSYSGTNDSRGANDIASNKPVINRNHSYWNWNNNSTKPVRQTPALTQSKPTGEEGDTSSLATPPVTQPVTPPDNSDDYNAPVAQQSKPPLPGLRVKTLLEEPLPDKAPASLYAIVADPREVEDVAGKNLQLNAVFTRNQNFYISGSTKLKDGTRLSIRGKRANILVFSTKLTVTAGRFEKFVAGWNKQLGEGIYDIICEFRKASPANAKLYTEDLVFHNTMSDKTSFELVKVTAEQLDEIFSQGPSQQDTGIAHRDPWEADPEPPATSDPEPAPPVIDIPEIASDPEIEIPPDIEEPPLPPDETIGSEITEPDRHSIIKKTPNLIRPTTAKLSNYFLNLSLTRNNPRPTKTHFRVTGKTNLPDNSEIIINLLFENDQFAQDVTTVKDGRFVYVYKVKAGRKCTYGQYFATAEFNVGVQPEEINNKFFVKDGLVSGQANLLLGTEHLANDRASSILLDYGTVFQDIDLSLDKLHSAYNVNMNDMDTEAWSNISARTRIAMQAILSKMGREAARTVALRYPSLNASIRRSALTIQDLVLAYTYSLYSKNNMRIEANPDLQLLREIHKDTNRMKLRSDKAIKILKKQLDEKRVILEDRK